MQRLPFHATVQRIKGFFETAEEAMHGDWIMILIDLLH